MTEYEYIVRNGLLLVFLGVAAFYDFRERRIPNWLTVAGFCAGVAWLAVFGGRDDWRLAGLGFAIGFGCMLLLYLNKGVGGGDVKLMGGIGLLAGYPDIIYLLFFGGLAAAAIIVGRLALNGLLGKTFTDGLRKAMFWRRKAEPEHVDPEDKKMRSASFAFALVLGLIWVRIMEIV